MDLDDDPKIKFLVRPARRTEDLGIEVHISLNLKNFAQHTCWAGSTRLVIAEFPSDCYQCAHKNSQNHSHKLKLKVEHNLTQDILATKTPWKFGLEQIILWIMAGSQSNTIISFFLTNAESMILILQK